MGLTEWICFRILGMAIDGATPPVGKFIASLLPKQDLEKLRLQLNDRFEDEVEIYCFNQLEPKIHIKGKHLLTPAQIVSAAVHREQLAVSGRPNDPHALLVNDPLWRANPVNLEVTTVDFSEICALRQEGLTPQIVSAGGVLLCRDKEELVLHRRGDVATYPNALHILGGAYIPDGSGVCDPDRAGLLSTAVREIHEETQAHVFVHDAPNMVMAKELFTGFIQLVFLGLPVHPKDIDRLRGNWEGNIERIPFKSLASVLNDPSWVPSGKAHVLAWLGLGAPNAKRGQKFGNQTAKQLFKSILEA
jgi:hypothetical protein